jgi:hypothetical protein
MPRLEKPPVADDVRAAVIDHVEKYVRSLLQPDMETLRQCFHNDGGTIFGVMGNTLAGGPIQALYDIMDRDGGFATLESTVQILAITPTTAVVQVLLFQEAPRYEVTDSLSLVRLPSGDWTIVNKVFEMYQYFK